MMRLPTMLQHWRTPRMPPTNRFRSPATTAALRTSARTLKTYAIALKRCARVAISVKVADPAVWVVDPAAAVLTFSSAGGGRGGAGGGGLKTNIPLAPFFFFSGIFFFLPPPFFLAGVPGRKRLSLFLYFWGP